MAESQVHLCARPEGNRYLPKVGVTGVVIDESSVHCVIDASKVLRISVSCGISVGRAS
jgi:hypothetical protein